MAGCVTFCLTQVFVRTVEHERSVMRKPSISFAFSNNSFLPAAMFRKVFSHAHKLGALSGNTCAFSYRCCFVVIKLYKQCRFS